MALSKPGGKLVRVREIIKILRKETKKFAPSAINQIVSEYGRDPFLILISCLLSLRTRDVTSVDVSRKLFMHARNPQELLKIPVHELEKMLYPLGFFRAKTKIIRSVCEELVERFDGQVPKSERDLLSIKGVGQKTAHAVLGYAFHIPALCVDTHVHQIANRLGWVRTSKPDETETQLKKIIPRNNWIELNYLFITWGQNICTPVSPFCSRCAIAHLCPKIGVRRKR